MIAIVDYGLGNVRAFANVLKKLNLPHVIASSGDQLEVAKKIILPGVGAFDYAMNMLIKSGMYDMLNSLVLIHNVPVLGVCVGMQLMANSSDEGVSKGLGWIDGHVKKFPVTDTDEISIPHMGWNTIMPIKNNNLLDGVDTHSKYYFLHSYYYDCSSKGDELAFTEYGSRFTCAIQKNNIFGVQFHPEKSHRWGEKLLENFARL